MALRAEGKAQEAEAMYREVLEAGHLDISFKKLCYREVCLVVHAYLSKASGQKGLSNYCESRVVPAVSCRFGSTVGYDSYEIKTVYS